MSEKPLVVDFAGLKRLGWPLSRTQTWRLMKATITVLRKVPGEKRRVAKVLPNPDIFPACHKATSHFNGKPLWRVSEVLAYLEARGLAVTTDWYSS